MSTTEQDIKKLVNVNLVAKAVKSIGHFALHSPNEDTNLVFTSSFILNLTEEQAWEVQCKLLAKNQGIWYYANGKEGLSEDKPVTPEQIDLYYKTVNNAALEALGRTDLYLDNTAIYVAPGKFIGVKRQYIDMLGDAPALKKAPMVPEFVVAADVHLLATVKGVKSDYLNLGML